ncbi:MAG: hypothetical protein ABIH23_13300 [bacterium]
MEDDSRRPRLFLKSCEEMAEMIDGVIVLGAPYGHAIDYDRHSEDSSQWDRMWKESPSTGSTSALPFVKDNCSVLLRRIRLNSLKVRQDIRSPKNGARGPPTNGEIAAGLIGG